MRGPWSVTAALLVLLAAACRRRGRKAPPRGRRRRAAGGCLGPDAGLAADTGQARWLPRLRAAPPGEPAALGPGGAAAVPGGGRGAPGARGGVRGAAAAHRAGPGGARADAGLTAAEVQALETLTAEVALARARGRAARSWRRRCVRWRRAKDQLPAEQRAGVERTVARLRDSRTGPGPSPRSGRSWGDAAVDTVLAREKAVLELWGVPVGEWRRRDSVGEQANAARRPDPRSGTPAGAPRRGREAPARRVERPEHPEGDGEADDVDHVGPERASPGPVAVQLPGHLDLVRERRP